MFNFKFKKSKKDLSPEEKFKEMIRSLKKPGKKRRFYIEEAIEYLGNKKDKRATKPLIEVLKNSSDHLRILVVKALGKIGDESAIEVLIHVLRGTNDARDPQNYAAREAIKMIGKPAIKFLIQALDDEDKSIYEGARDILIHFGKLSVSPLLKALKDEHPQVRMQAVIALGSIGDKRAAKPLHQVLMIDFNENVREEAVFALGEMKDKRSVEELIRFLGDPTRGSEKVMRLLGEIGDARAVEPLIERLKWSYTQKTNAAEALVKIGDERAVLPLIAAAKKDIEEEKEWQIKNPPHRIPFAERGDDYGLRWATKALISFGKPTVEPLFKLLKEDSFYWGEFIEVLARIGQPTVKPMIHALKSPCSKTRSLAADVLGRIRWTEIEPFLQALNDEDEEYCKVIRNAVQKVSAVDQLIIALRDESHHVRRNVVMVLGRIRDKKASDPLILMMLDASEGVRKEAALALGHLREKSAVEPLIENLSHNDITMRESAAKALGEIGDERAIEPLIKILMSSDVSLIAVTEDALGMIGKSTIEPLVQALAKKDIEPYRALNLLANIGKPAIEPLFQLFGDQCIEGDILEALIKIGPLAVKPLIHAIKHESVSRELGYAAIVKIGEPAVEPLLQLLANKNVETNVIEVLVKIGKPAIVPLKNYLYTRSGFSDREKIEAIIGMISN